MELNFLNYNVMQYRNKIFEYEKISYIFNINNIS